MQTTSLSAPKMLRGYCVSNLWVIKPLSGFDSSTSFHKSIKPNVSSYISANVCNYSSDVCSTQRQLVQSVRVLLIAQLSPAAELLLAHAFTVCLHRAAIAPGPSI